MGAPRVLVTGAAGYIGSQLIAALAADAARKPAALVAMDVREVPVQGRLPGVTAIAGSQEATTPGYIAGKKACFQNGREVPAP